MAISGKLQEQLEQIRNAELQRINKNLDEVVKPEDIQTMKDTLLLIQKARIRVNNLISGGLELEERLNQLNELEGRINRLLNAIE